MTDADNEETAFDYCHCHNSSFNNSCGIDVINQHMYPQDALHETSNLCVRGIVTSIEQNHKSQGMIIISYHIFRFYIHLNITEIVWVEEDYAGLISPDDNNTVMGWNSIGVGYDNLDDPQLVIGQAVECKGHYMPATDSPWSFMLTVAPSINGSYLEQLALW